MGILQDVNGIINQVNQINNTVNTVRGTIDNTNRILTPNNVGRGNEQSKISIFNQNVGFYNIQIANQLNPIEQNILYSATPQEKQTFVSSGGFTSLKNTLNYAFQATSTSPDLSPDNKLEIAKKLYDSYSNFANQINPQNVRNAQIILSRLGTFDPKDRNSVYFNLPSPNSSYNSNYSNGYPSYPSSPTNTPPTSTVVPTDPNSPAYNQSNNPNYDEIRRDRNGNVLVETDPNSPRYQNQPNTPLPYEPYLSPAPSGVDIRPSEQPIFKGDNPQMKFPDITAVTKNPNLNQNIHPKDPRLQPVIALTTGTNSVVVPTSQDTQATQNTNQPSLERIIKFSGINLKDYPSDLAHHFEKNPIFRTNAFKAMGIEDNQPEIIITEEKLSKLQMFFTPDGRIQHSLLNDYVRNGGQIVIPDYTSSLKKAWNDESIVNEFNKIIQEKINSGSITAGGANDLINLISENNPYSATEWLHVLKNGGGIAAAMNSEKMANTVALYRKNNINTATEAQRTKLAEAAIKENKSLSM
jgi:hypothetical protein